MGNLKYNNSSELQKRHIKYKWHSWLVLDQAAAGLEQGTRYTGCRRAPGSRTGLSSKIHTAATKSDNNWKLKINNWSQI